jgi:hypothetical protein
MEINLITRNGITPNPTVEFLELCNIAVKCITENSLNAIVELESKFIDLFKEDTLISLEKRWEFRRLSINIVYANRGEGIQHRFISHYDNISNCPSNYGELNPVIFAY